jgi:uncharacterized Zn finger protein
MLSRKRDCQSKSKTINNKRLKKVTTNGSPNRMLCPKCGSEMEYIIEKERLGNGEIKIRMYYKCPVCGTIILDQKITLKKTDGKIEALIEDADQVLFKRKNVRKSQIIKKLKALGLLK